jgi:hypothetical protein
MMLWILLRADSNDELKLLPTAIKKICTALVQVT